MTFISSDWSSASAWGSTRRRETPLLLYCVLGVAALAGIYFWTDPERLSGTLGDTDDATRLVQVREWLAGAPWFDTTLPLFGASEHLVSHWSRLIDLGIGALLTVLRLVMPEARAEIVARCIWPLMILLPLTHVLAIESERRSGRVAALVAIGLTVTCFTGVIQFLPGRIDHHNGMILGAVSGVMLLARSLKQPHLGWPAGIGFGIGTAIGYEALALTAACLVSAGLFTVVTGRGAPGILRTAIGFAGTLLMAFLVTTGPDRWLTSHCDALSLNLVVLATSAAAALSIALLPGQGWSVHARLIILGGLGAIACVLYAAAEPACLKGPFGELDPAIGPLWLATVAETQNVFWLLTSTPAHAITFVLSSILGIACAWRVWSENRDDGMLLNLIALIVAASLACWQIKLMPYASFLAIPPTAAVIARISASPYLSAGTARTLTAIVCSQFFIICIAQPLGAAVVPLRQDIVDWTKSVRECLQTKSLTPLASLPKGLYFADRDLGPFIVALTGNRVVAAPYHRMDKAIIETEQILSGPVSGASQRLSAMGVDYVAICPGLTPPAANSQPDSLLQQLRAGGTLPFLEPMPPMPGSPLKVWRLKQG